MSSSRPSRVSVNGVSWTARSLRSATSRLQVVDDAVLVVEGVARPGGFVVEDDLHAAVEVAGDLEALAECRRVELDAREDRRVGVEEDGGAGAARRPGLDDGALRLALLELLLPRGAVAPDGGDELLRERVDDRGADAVQAARGLVVLALELAAGVELVKMISSGALAGLGMLVDGDAAAVVGDGDARPSLCSVTTIATAWPFMASSTELSTISQTRWCRPALPMPPMYMPGRLRTGSRPSRTVMSFAV